MYYTQAEAPDMWCPLSRDAGFEQFDVGGAGLSFNREIEYARNEDGSLKEDPEKSTPQRVVLIPVRASFPPSCCCITTRCPKWEWHDGPTPPNMDQTTTRRGYCGAFGRPE